jgi:hypothetical protein
VNILRGDLLRAIRHRQLPEVAEGDRGG